MDKNRIGYALQKALNNGFTVLYSRVIGIDKVDDKVVSVEQTGNVLSFVTEWGSSYSMDCDIVYMGMDCFIEINHKDERLIIHRLVPLSESFMDTVNLLSEWPVVLVDYRYGRSKLLIHNKESLQAGRKTHINGFEYFTFDPLYTKEEHKDDLQSICDILTGKNKGA